MLHAVHFTLAPGQKVGGVGVHGCGKTTLLRIVAGDLSPDAGIARWHDPAAQEEAHRCLTLQQPTEASSAAGPRPSNGGCRRWRRNPAPPSRRLRRNCRLLLETRCAFLAGRLAEANLPEDERAVLQREYIQVARELHSLGRKPECPD